jgi:hypothetical protein
MRAVERLRMYNKTYQDIAGTAPPQSHLILFFSKYFFSRTYRVQELYVSSFLYMQNEERIKMRSVQIGEDKL